MHRRPIFLQEEIILWHVISSSLALFIHPPTIEIQLHLTTANCFQNARYIPGSHKSKLRRLPARSLSKLKNFHEEIPLVHWGRETLLPKQNTRYVPGSRKNKLQKLVRDVIKDQVM